MDKVNKGNKKYKKMANKTSKIYYRIDIRRTMEAMEINAPASVRITGEDRDCAIGSLYRIKDAIENECDKRFTISKCNYGTEAEIIRIA